MNIHCTVVREWEADNQNLSHIELKGLILIRSAVCHNCFEFYLFKKKFYQAIFTAGMQRTDPGETTVGY